MEGSLILEDGNVVSFVAIDFETADNGRDSACSVGMVRVDGDRITAREHRLIRPPRRHFIYTYIHGLKWTDVQFAPVFADVWRDVKPILEGAEFLAAHNAGFDRGVLSGCCRAGGLKAPDLPWTCTVQLSRHVLNIRPANLGHVCRTLGIPLRHHEALSDAEACARIVLLARAVRPFGQSGSGSMPRPSATRL
ncbi:MAG: 3'-5' exonuclease [Acidobacteriota bacterium]